MTNLRTPNININRLNRQAIKLLSNLKFAILVLLIIAACSILGTVIEQNQSLEFYQDNYPKATPILGVFNWENIIFLNLDNVYRSWWYLSLLVILGISLITCSFSQQLPMVRSSKYWRFIRRKKQLQDLDLKLKLDLDNFSKVVNTLNSQTYNIFQHKDFLFGYKGIVGRTAPIIVHISIIQIFLGAIFGALFGYGGQEVIPRSEVFHLQNVLNAGKFSSSPIETAVRINDFWIDYNTELDNRINQFYSDVSILDSRGNELRRKVISVNNPLHYKNITLYQSDWDISGIRGHFENEENSRVQYQTKKIKVAGGNRWLVQMSVKKDRKNLLIKDLNKEISLYDANGDFIEKIREGNKVNIGNKNFIIDEVLPSTGVDIKSDPGIPFVYLGFLALITSTMLSFISFSKVWVFQRGQEIFIGGISNRAKIAFERYFLEQISSLK